MPNFEQFPLFPDFRLLDNLVDGSLNQSQNLITAMRRWRLINWFYGDGEQNLQLTRELRHTFNEFCQAFFQLQPPQESNHPQGKFMEKLEDILKPHNLQCPCYKTTKDWLTFYGFSVIQWQEDLQKYIAITDKTFDHVLQDRLFAKTRRTLQNDIKFLTDKSCIQFKESVSKKQNIIERLEQLPDWLIRKVTDQIEYPADHNLNLNPTELADLAQALDLIAFLDPKLYPIAEKLSLEVSGTRRVFLHVDYVVPEDIQAEADDLQARLQDNWRWGTNKPILFQYNSARLGRRECIAYPVCIYYIQRAKYLCAYGINPDEKITWYNYRLERIKSEELLEWSDTRVPQFLLEQYQQKRLPQPTDVEAAIKQVWGFDFYQPASLMLLRFDRNFHDSYIKDTFRHETFNLVKSSQEVRRLIEQLARNSAEEARLLDVWQRYPQDAYYTAKYRVNDNNVIMRLRAWGANVEILLPTELRDRMAQDIQAAYKLYHN